MKAALLVALLPLAVPPAAAQEPLYLQGGWLFDSAPDFGDERIANPGLLLTAGKILARGEPAPDGVRVLEIADGDTILPGFFDLHAHHGMNLLGRGRVDETEVNPLLFLANGVTSVFPAGEMDPDKMAALAGRIARGESDGPRLHRSGPYYGRARPGWNRNTTAEQIHAEVDALAAEGVRGFKAKNITAAHLAPLIERAHHHGLTVTGHLGSGNRGSVNPADAIALGIDRIEHFLGGDDLPADRSAYASLEHLDPGSEAFARTCALYVTRGTFFDATLSAYGYYGEREPLVFEDWADERSYFTPWFREWKAEQPPRRVIDQFERIYHVKRRSLKAFYDAGGGDLITLGTDHPSDGDFISGFSVHREMHCMSLAGLPNAAVLRIATRNGARALGLGDRLGTLENGKLADLVVVAGDPIADIRATRAVRHVVRGGVLHDPEELKEQARGRIGPADESAVTDWVRRMRRR